MKDEVITFGQKPTIEEIKDELLKLNTPCYASIRRTDGSYAGKITAVVINCDLVHVVAIQDRLKDGEQIEIEERFTIKLKDITSVIHFSNPMRS